MSTEYILLGKKLEQVRKSAEIANQAYREFLHAKDKLDGRIATIGMMVGHDEDEEDFELAPTEGGGLKIIFKPKEKPEEVKDETSKEDSDTKE